MLEDLLQFKNRIKAKAHLLVPDIRWDGSHHRSEELKKPETVQ